MIRNLRFEILFSKKSIIFFLFINEKQFFTYSYYFIFSDISKNSSLCGRMTCIGKFIFTKKNAKEDI